MKIRVKDIPNFLASNRIFLFILAICLVTQLMNPYFLSSSNIASILKYISIEGIIAIGMAFLIVIREIDLSVGAILSLSCTCAIYLQPYGVMVGLLSGIVVGTALGFLNGIITVKTGVNSLPITLGMMVLINGTVYVITKSQSVPGTNAAFNMISDSMIFGLEIVVYLFILLVAIFDFVLKKTYFGRSVYAVGGNSAGAQCAGIHVAKIRVSVFTLTGFLAGLAGVMTAARYNIASGLIGQQTSLAVITAVLIGGISLSGGEGSVLKAFLGFLFMGVLENAMKLMKFPTPLQPIIVGTILVIMLAIDAVNIRKQQFR